MKRRILTGWAALFTVGATALTVFGYNLWSYCCGHCTASTFFTLGPFGLTLLALNILAAVILVVLRVRRRMRHSEFRCGCGSVLAEGWEYCPDCGEGASSIDS